MLAEAAWRAIKSAVFAAILVSGIVPVACAQTSAAPATPGGASRDYLAEIRANFTPEDRLYARVNHAVALFEPVYEIGVMLVLLFSGASAWMRDAVRRRFRGRYLRTLGYLGLFTLGAAALQAPLTIFRDFYWQHRFGLSHQGFGSWLWDEVKAAGLGVLWFGGTGIIALAFWGIEKAGRRWWLWIGAGVLPVLVAGAIVEPVVFEPAFNRFRPLENQALRAKIVALAERSGIPGRRVLEVDRSRQTSTLNAYVSGFGPSQRIVIWDTTLRAMREDEVLVVMGHEMGHYRLHHIWKGIALASLLAFALFWLGDRIMRAALARFGERWRVRSIADEASLPLFVAALTLCLTIAQPALVAFSRHIEHEADRFGLDVTHSNDAAARAFIALARQNRSDPEPSPIVKWLIYTHPPLAERVRFALEYRPWERGVPPR